MPVFRASFTYSQKSLNNLTEILVGYLRDNVQQTKKIVSAQLITFFTLKFRHT